MRLGFFGDPHSDYGAVARAVVDGPADTSVFLGDFDLTRPLDEELSALSGAGSDIWYIHGNHDTDTVEWYDFVFGSKLADRNLAGRIVDIDGIRVAGLGGVFRSKVWDPRRSNAEPFFMSRQEFVGARPHALWRGGLPRRHRSTVFPEDFAALSKESADILVTHEAPSTHKFGYRQIDKLAECMGVELIVHGHHHEAYESVLPNGIKVVGMGQADYRTVDFEPRRKRK